MKRILFIIVSLLLFSAAYAYDVYEVTATRLNVRRFPSTSASVIGGVAKGEQLEVIDIDNKGWAKIQYHNREGYVSTKYLKFVRSVNPTPVEPTVVVEEVVEEEPVEETPTVINEDPVSYTDEEFGTLINGPSRISNNFELYYGLSAGVGFSTFIWDGDFANGKLTYTGDLFVQLCCNNKVSFIPPNYFFELQLGYDGKGAAWYNMSYVHARIYPLGYKIPLNTFKLVGKAGLYLGYPLNDLEAYEDWDTWSGNFQVGVTAGIGVEYKQFGLCANVEYNVTEVASTPVTLRNFAVFGTLSYKFGKLKH